MKENHISTIEQQGSGSHFNGLGRRFIERFAPTLAAARIEVATIYENAATYLKSCTLMILPRRVRDATYVCGKGAESIFYKTNPNPKGEPIIWNRKGPTQFLSKIISR